MSYIPIDPGGACSIRTNEPLARPRLSKPLPWTSRPMLQRYPVTSSGASQSLRPVSTRGRCNSPGLALVWSGRQKSNLRPDAPKATALPTALRPDIWYVPGRPCTIRTCDCLSQSQVPWSSLANGLWMEYWRAPKESNLQPPVLETGVLPIELGTQQAGGTPREPRTLMTFVPGF